MQQGLRQQVHLQHCVIQLVDIKYLKCWHRSLLYYMHDAHTHTEARAFWLHCTWNRIMHIAHTQREPSNTAHSSLRAVPVGVERFRLKVTLLPAKLDVSRSLFLFFFFSFCEHTTNSNDFYISSMPLLLSLFLPWHLPILHHQANRQAGSCLSFWLPPQPTLSEDILLCVL